MHRLSSRHAFSLLEVLLAVALFAGTVTVILALLPGMARQTVDTTDRLAAQRLPDAVRVELMRVATRSGWEALAARIPVMDAASASGFTLVATRDGTRVQVRDEQPPADCAIPEHERFFLIEYRRFSEGPLRYEAGQRALPLYIEVSWPYRGSSPAARITAAQFRFVVSLNL
jgi:type II secretory pathway pseudopilin PulG